jgi:hypothetical protein
MVDQISSGTPMQFRIIWPERRLVSEQDISMWYQDAIDNGQLADEGLTNPVEQAQALHQEGHITLAR